MSDQWTEVCTVFLSLLDYHTFQQTTCALLGVQQHKDIPQTVLIPSRKKKQNMQNKKCKLDNTQQIMPASLLSISARRVLMRLSDVVVTHHLDTVNKHVKYRKHVKEQR